MARFMIYADSGVSISSSAKTLTGAKREASKWMSFGGGSVYVKDTTNGEVLMRPFWRNLSHFGWGRWEFCGCYEVLDDKEIIK